MYQHIGGSQDNIASSRYALCLSDVDHVNSFGVLIDCCSVFRSSLVISLVFESWRVQDVFGESFLEDIVLRRLLQ